MGLFSFAAAGLCGRNGYVLAIEADLQLAGLLCRSTRFQVTDSAAVFVLPVAASDRVGVSEFIIAKRGRSANHLAQVPGSTQSGGIRETIFVMTITLDWLLERFPAPNLLKIDVEGAEHRVLEGARKLLATAQPIVLCEVHEENSQTVADLLKTLDYSMFDLQVLGKNRKSLELPAFNTLAMPLRELAQLKVPS